MNPITKDFDKSNNTESKLIIPRNEIVVFE